MELPDEVPGGGLTLGTVLANNDAQKKGLLKIKLIGGQENILEGVKLVAMSAGKDYGSVWLPEVGEQVLVGFLNGCYDRPVVLGSLFTAADQMLTGSFHKSNALKRFRTKGGTEVEFNDEKDRQSATIKTPGKLSVCLEDHPQTITILAGDTKLTLDGKSGKLTLEAKKELSFKTGSAQITLKSGGDIVLKGTKVEVSGSSATVKSSGTLTMKGQKSELSGTVVEVKSSGMLTVKGSLTKIN